MFTYELDHYQTEDECSGNHTCWAHIPVYVIRIDTERLHRVIFYIPINLILGEWPFSDSKGGFFRSMAI
jgi:hypothetical protein